MKKAIVFTASIISLMTFATGQLDGTSYCRKLKGVLGNPEAILQHCISFDKGFASDSANTFFGNPPAAPVEYQMDNKRVIFGTQEYELSDDASILTTINGSSIAGTIFTRCQP